MKTITYHTVESDANFADMVAPEKHIWDWVKKPSNGEVHIFEDELLPDHTKYNDKIKIAFLRESPLIYDYVCNNNPSVFHPYRWLKDNHQHFTYVLSPFANVKDIVGDKYLWVPSGGSRIQMEDFGMYEKERNLSICASHKRWTVGHILRHQVIEKYQGKIDLYGSGYNSIVNNFNGKFGKILSSGPYRFSFAIMNNKQDFYFTEILTDVLATGTIPIWWGTDKIGNYFNADGIISFNSIDDLEAILPKLTEELYQSKLPAIQENVEIAKQYRDRFTWVYNNYKNKFESL